MQVKHVFYISRSPFIFLQEKSAILLVKAAKKKKKSHRHIRENPVSRLPEDAAPDRQLQKGGPFNPSTLSFSQHSRFPFSFTEMRPATTNLPRSSQPSPRHFEWAADTSSLTPLRPPYLGCCAYAYAHPRKQTDDWMFFARRGDSWTPIILSSSEFTRRHGDANEIS